MNAAEKGNQRLLRRHRSEQRPLVGSEGLNNGPASETAASIVHDLGGKATQHVIIPPTPTEIPPADYAG